MIMDMDEKENLQTKFADEIFVQNDCASNASNEGSRGLIANHHARYCKLVRGHTNR
jgi:hypothetical protein